MTDAVDLLFLVLPHT